MRIVRREPLTDDPTVGGFIHRHAAAKEEASEEAQEASIEKLNVTSLNLQVVSRRVAVCRNGEPAMFSLIQQSWPVKRSMPCTVHNIADCTHTFPSSTAGLQVIL